MWAELKMNHVTAMQTRRARIELAVIALAVAAIAVLLWTITSLARDQVHKAEMRDALRQSQRVAMARCWQEAPGPLAMRNCISQVREQTSMALAQSYGLPQHAMGADDTPDAAAGVSTVAGRDLTRDLTREPPITTTADVSLVSMRY